MFIFVPYSHYDEPKTLSYFMQPICLLNADGGHAARDKGDIEVMREIANDPDGFIAKNGWGKIDISEGDAHEDLWRLYRAIEIQIVERIEALELLRESSEFELMTKCRVQQGLLNKVAEQHREALIAEIEQLASEAEALQDEIEGLNGAGSGI